MKYFKVEAKNNEAEKGIITKYDVSFDINKLKEIRAKIINNCSEIIHMERVGVEYPICNKNIRNYKSVDTGKTTTGEYEDSIYNIEYDKYNYSKLADYLEEIIDGNSNYLDLVLSYDEKIEDFEEFRLMKEKKECVSLLKNASEDDPKFDEYIRKIDELNAELQKITRKSDTSLLKEYLKEVYENIYFKKEEEMPVYVYRKYEKFFEEAENRNLVQGKIKSLKKIKKDCII